MLRGLSFSLFLINLAAILERADESLLPAVYKEVSEAFKASPSELGSLTFIRTIVQAVCSPLAGILAMRYYRPSVIGLGTLFWAVSTAVVALSFTFTQCAFSRALNGIGLAIVVPALQSFIADSHSEAGRGMAFGWLNLVGSVGGIAGSGIATVMAGYGSIWGIAGWRVAFLLVASVSCVIGWVVHIFVLDPRDNAVSGSSSYREFDGCVILHLSSILNLVAPWSRGLLFLLEPLLIDSKDHVWNLCLEHFFFLLLVQRDIRRLHHFKLFADALHLDSRPMRRWERAFRARGWMLGLQSKR